SLSGGGGAERVWALLASFFARRGDDVLLVLDEDGDRASLDPRVRVETVGGGLAGVPKLAGILRREQPDVAASAVSGNGTKLILAKILSVSRTPLVMSFHGFEEFK